MRLVAERPKTMCMLYVHVGWALASPHRVLQRLTSSLCGGAPRTRLGSCSLCASLGVDVETGMLNRLKRLVAN